MSLLSFFHIDRSRLISHGVKVEGSFKSDTLYLSGAIDRETRKGDSTQLVAMKLELENLSTRREAAKASTLEENAQVLKLS